MRQTELRLSSKDKRVVAEMRAKGLHHAREVNRAHILAALDRKVSGGPDHGSAWGWSVRSIWRTRAAYLEGGLDHWRCTMC